MAAFESFGYCPHNEIMQNQSSEWLELSEKEKGYKSGLWSLVGPYLVCSEEEYSVVEAPSSIFFETKVLGNDVLKSLIKRYNFKALSPIWIKKPDLTVLQYIFTIVDNDPEILISPVDAGKLVIISNGKHNELILAYWDISVKD